MFNVACTIQLMDFAIQGKDVLIVIVGMERKKKCFLVMLNHLLFVLNHFSLSPSPVSQYSTITPTNLPTLTREY